jgi:adenylylsulfate kinase-like enzyme
MILVIFGQPHSGKTTLARHMSAEINGWILDGDRMRHVFQDRDFTRPGRIKNLNRASDIAVFQHSMHPSVIVSMVYPYREARDYLTKMCKRLEIPLVWVYLYYHEERGREHFHVQDFELPNHANLWLNTTNLSEDECIRHIKFYIDEYNSTGK